MKFNNSQRGQSLIEVLIALAAAVAIAAAIAVTVITSLNNVDFTKNQNLATQYSREGLEVVRQLAKNNWTNFTSTYQSVNYCLSEGSSDLTLMGPSGCSQNVGLQNENYLFKRQIVIDQNPVSKCVGTIDVTSIVSWSDNRCLVGNVFCHSVSLESCFADINTIKPL